jgi:hypothetical protein
LKGEKMKNTGDNEMKKKIMTVLVAVVLFFSVVVFAGCVSDPIEYFDSLDNLQAAVSGKTMGSSQEEFCYFEFANADFSKNAEFSATKKKNQEVSVDTYYRYSIWFDIVGADAERTRFGVTASYTTRPLSIASKQWRSSVVIGDNSCSLLYAENEKTLVLVYNFNGYNYYFFLKGVQSVPGEDDVAFLLSICEPAIESRYQIVD